MTNLKINRTTFPQVEYVSIPKADGSGNATFRNTEGFYNNSDFAKIIKDELVDINDSNGEITGELRQYAFYNCDNLESVILPEITGIGQSCFSFCNKLEYVELTNCKKLGGGYNFDGDSLLQEIYLPKLVLITNNGSRGSYCFRNCGKLQKLILGQDQVTRIDHGYITDHFNGTANVKYYVPSDLLQYYKTFSLWSSYSSRFLSIKQLDHPEYVLYYIDPTLPSNCKPLCKYQTSVETVYGRQSYIVGLAQDTLSIEAVAAGYTTKTTTINIDSSTTTIIPDLSDMVVDANFNGYNLLYADFTKFQFNCGSYGNVVNTNFGIFSNSEDIRHLGVGNFVSGGYFNYSVTLPDYSEMTNPTIIFEANTYFVDSDDVSNFSPLIGCGWYDGGLGIYINRNSARYRYGGSYSINLENLNLLGDHHISFVANGTTCYIYIDGVLSSTVNTAYVFNGLKGTSLLIGSDVRDTGRRFRGHVKQLALTIRDIADPSVAANCEFILPIPQQAQP